MKFSLILPMFLLLACGGKNHSSSKSPAKKATPVTPTTTTLDPEPEPAKPQTEILSEAGDYQLSFARLNKKVSFYKGSGTLKMNETHLEFAFSAVRASPLRSAIQSFYAGECPTLAQDKNGDGYVDIQEAKELLGKKLLTLDLDLDGTNPNETVYPRISVLGRYSYARKATINTFLSDIDARYGVTQVDLEKSVILIQGVPTFFRLPASVATQDSLPKVETIPVACAKVSKNIATE